MAKQVEYDGVASSYDRRYEQNDYEGVERAVRAFVGVERGRSILEVGCGTGHWLRILSGRAAHVVGVDPSRAMLERARTKAPAAVVAQARAEALPWCSASFDRSICINALHHFTEPATFFREARRTLCPGGGLLVVGLDPHVGVDCRWIYDYFPAALQADRKRYLATSAIRRLMAEAAFTDCATEEVQRFPAEISFRAALSRGLLERTSISQFMVIDAEDYDRGVMRLRKAQATNGEADLMLRADLRLYGTSGWLPTAATEGGSMAGRPLQPTTSGAQRFLPAVRA